MGEGAREGGIEGQRLNDGKGEMGRDSMLQKAAELGELELHRRRCRDERARGAREPDVSRFYLQAFTGI